MLVLITYDVNTETPEGQRRLRRVSRLCKNYGQRVQKSVFECSIDPARWKFVRAALIAEVDELCDSLRFYFLGADWQRKVEHVGANPGYDPEGPLVV